MIKQREHILSIGYPQQMKYLHYLLESGKIDHAYCVVGSENGAQYLFSEYAAQLLLCTERTQAQHPCDSCVSCAQYTAGIHPDLLLVQPQQGGVIPVERATEIRRFLSTPAIRSSKKVVIIHDAEQLNNTAANALLKVIEEPAVDSVVFCTTQESAALLPTIQSRVQCIRLPAVSRDTAHQILDTIGVSADRTEDCVERAAGKLQLLLENCDLSTTEDSNAHYAFWFRFLRAAPVDRQRLIDEYTKRSGAQEQTLQQLNDALGVIEALLHDILLASVAAHGYYQSRISHADLTAFAQTQSPLFFTKQLRMIQKLRSVTRLHGNKKMIFEYLTIHV